MRRDAVIATLGLAAWTGLILGPLWMLSGLPADSGMFWDSQERSVNLAVGVALCAVGAVAAVLRSALRRR